MNYKLIGSPCGEHGPYTFYKAFMYTKNGKSSILALSEFFFVKLWPDSDLISIGELQLLWEDKNTEQTLASLRLYILPENTPDGRNDIHGEDEVLAISEKVVLRVEDLLTWITTATDWHWGLGAVWTPDVKKEINGEDEDVKPELSPCMPTSLPLYPKSSAIDMEDIIKEKHKLDPSHWETMTGVVVLSYPRYCRYRGLMKRLEGVYNKWLRNTLILALGGFTVPFRNTRVLFCKDTFDYPDLEGHELLCNHLAPKLKGRPRRKRKKVNLSESEDSASESESSQSTSSSGTKSSTPSLEPKVSGAKPRLRCTLEVNRRPPITNTPSIMSGANQKGSSIDEKRFLTNLHAFMRSKNTPIGRIPVVGFKEVNLFKLYKKVSELGGYDIVTANKLWKHVYEVTGGDLNCTSAATLSRRHYEKLLLPYERFLRSQLKSKIVSGTFIPTSIPNAPQRIGAVKISPVRNIRLKPEKVGEKENIPEKHKNETAAASVTIIKKDGAKEEVVDLMPQLPIKIPKGPCSPYVKKQKLDILKEGGLEVTPIAGMGVVGASVASLIRPVKEVPLPPPPPAMIRPIAPSGIPNSKVSITVTPDLSHLIYPYVRNSPGPSTEQRALYQGILPVETVMGAASNTATQQSPIDLRKTKPGINIGSNLEISLVPAKKASEMVQTLPPPLPQSRIATLVKNQLYRMKSPHSPFIIDPAFLCGNIVTQKVVVPPHLMRPPMQPPNFYKDLLRSEGIFNLLPDGSTSISLVGGKSTPTSK